MVTSLHTTTATVVSPAGRPAPHQRRGLILAVLCVTLLLISLDNTVLNVALPSIVGSLGATTSQLQWAVDASPSLLPGYYCRSGRSATVGP